MSAVVVRAENLSVRYGRRRALSGVSLEVRAGQITSLLGANGAGKSTLLKALVGVVQPWSGTISYEAIKPSRISPGALSRCGVSMVPEGRRIFGDSTVDDNLRIGAVNHRDPKWVREGKERVFSLFPDLRGRGSQVAGTLSGGQQQMLAIGRALMNRPKVLLLDEPSLGVSPKLTLEIYAALEELRDGGTTIVLVEQYAWLALRVSSWTYGLQSGRLVRSAPPDQLTETGDLAGEYLGSAGPIESGPGAQVVV